ncbi:MAG: hypothetical protein ACPGWS_09455, partial [Solirubrobacterales bacterium]
MRKPRITQFRTRVSREGVVTGRDAFNQTATTQSIVDTANYQQDIEDGKLDRLDLEETTNSTIEEASALRDRLDAVGPLGVVAYLHVRTLEGKPETLGAFNCRLGEMDAQLPVIFLIPLAEPYT